MTTHQNTSKQHRPLQGLALAALVAGALALPASAQATPLDQVKSRVDQTHNQVKKIKNDVADIVADVNERRLMIQDAGIEELQETIRSIIAYMRQAQAGYQAFVAPDNCGSNSDCGAFRDELHDTILDFAELPESLPFVDQVPSSVQQLYKAADAVDYIPPVVLYAGDMAIGDSMDEVQGLIAMLRDAAAGIPPLPTTDDIKAVVSQRSSAALDEVCAVDLEADHIAPHINLVLTILGNTADTLSGVAGFMQDEITGTVAVGTSVKNPYKLYFEIMSFLMADLKRKLENRLALLDSVCAINKSWKS